jgi:Ran GTPase-activating protein (RanGAP) involved in mRNA processing and transport
MDKRNLKTTGFPDTDREILQKAFDSEFHQDLENARALRREVRRRAARQAGLQKRRMNMEKLLQEEQNELAKNHYSGMMIELIKENKLDASCRIDANSISARSLAKALWSNNTITCLDLSSNGLNDHAGSYLARSLKRNNSIRKLELDSNAFGPSTCVAFGEALRVNTTLMSLSLDSNPLSDYNGSNLHGITALAEVLGVNKTLKSLNLWRTGVGPEGGAIITRNMLRNTTLLFLDVSHNDFAMKDMVKLASQLEKNLASFEQQERRRRNQAELDMQEEHKQKCIEEVMCSVMVQSLQ